MKYSFIPSFYSPVIRCNFVILGPLLITLYDMKVSNMIEKSDLTAEEMFPSANQLASYDYSTKSFSATESSNHPCPSILKASRVLA